jgi:geranyl-CoA carboxylase beta subunit
VVHGSSTAGGAYMPGLSDYVIMVRGRAKAFLAGPPLLKAATGEVATDEELGGAEMHAPSPASASTWPRTTPTACAWPASVLAGCDWNRPARPRPASSLRPRRVPDRRAAGRHLMPLDIRKPSTCARSSPASSTAPTSSTSGPTTACDRVRPRRADGHAVGMIGNNGPIDPAGATKATHFIQACCQSGTPLLYLQNTTGYIVGKASEQAGMIKHGSKMIQAVANATVPQITLHVRRQLRRRQLRHVRPRLRPALRVLLAQREAPR